MVSTIRDYISAIAARRRLIGFPPSAAFPAPKPRIAGGWVELMMSDTEDVLMRGNLFLLASSPRVAWQGEIESVRMQEGLATLELGSYRLRFGESGEIRAVALETTQVASSGSIAVTFLDARPPIVATEHGGE